ncbi:MAG: zinc/manganese transport system permease protein [Alphaproteobacteria bacterium]
MNGVDFLTIVAPALVAGLMIATIHGPLGLEVLRRGIIFIDLAIAQIAGLCVVLVDLLSQDASWPLRQVSAMAAALLAAWFFRIVEKRFPKEQEPIIGACFVLAASATLLALANHPHGGEKMQDILSGQLLFVSWSEIAAFAPLYAVAFVVWFGWPRAREGSWFFAIFALVVTASVQLAGVYVVFASLILPALAANTVRSGRVVAAMIGGWVAVLIGIGVSVWTDMPVGPLIAFACAAVMIFARGYVSLRSWG